MKTKCGLVCALAVAAVLVASCRQQQQPQASVSDTTSQLIEPGVAVGKVRAGMTVDQVRSQLGPPQFTTANALEYTKLGFAVMPGVDGVVQVVMCGDVTGNNGPLIKCFQAKTKEGVGLGSTRDELVKAYGEPSADEKFPGNRESMKYDALAITFSLESGRIHHMIVRLNSGTNSAPAPSIEISK